MNTTEYIRHIKKVAKNTRQKQPEFLLMMNSIDVAIQKSIPDFGSKNYAYDQIYQFMEDDVINPLINFAKAEYKINSDIYATDFPTGDVNAHAILSPDSDIIILLDEGMNYAIYYYNIIQLFQGLYRPDDIERGQFLWTNYVALLKNYITSQPYVPVKPYELLSKGNASSYLSELGARTIAQETYVLSHELGHILAGHLANCRIRNVDISNVTLKALEKSQAQEYEADQVGLNLYINFIEKKVMGGNSELSDLWVWGNLSIE